MKPMKILYIRHSDAIGGEEFPIVGALREKYGDCVQFRLPYGSRWTTFGAIMFKLRHLKRYDAIITTEYNIAFVICLRLLLQRLPTRHVVVGLNLSGRPIRLGLAPLDALFNRIFGRLDGIIVHSREEIEQFSALHNLSLDRFAFSPWGFDLPEASAPSTLFLADQPPYFCMIGRNNRDFETFVMAVEASNSRGVIICGSKDKVLNDVHPLITEYHDLPMEECIACVRHALANVILVNDANRGAGHITAVMAMLLAKPQIFSSVAVLQDYLASEETGIGVPLHDVGAVAAAMDRFKAEPTTVAAFGNAAQQRAADDFSHEATSRRTLAMITTFVEAGPSAV
jgi:glycosyltransferase involved in cell wall biosynthesis